MAGYEGWVIRSDWLGTSKAYTGINAKDSDDGRELFAGNYPAECGGNTLK